MFAAVYVFILSTRMCTIKIKTVEGILDTKNARTDTRAQL